MLVSGTFKSAPIDTITFLKLAIQAGAFVLWMRHLRHVPVQLRPIVWFMVLALVVEYSALVLAYLGAHNTLLYKIWISTMITLLSYWLMRTVRHTVAIAAIAVSLAVYIALFGWESTRDTGDSILFQHSLLFGYAFLTVACAAQLVRLATTCTERIWKEPEFWVYIAFFASLGPAIPFLGMMNNLYVLDNGQADSLFLIVEILFLVQFTLLGVAGLMLRKPLRYGAHGRG